MASLALAPSRLRWKALRRERDPPACLNRAQEIQGSPLGEESTSPPRTEPTIEETAKKVRQGVWGDTTATVLPETYELSKKNPDAMSTPERLDPQPTNEELVDRAKAS